MKVALSNLFPGIKEVINKFDLSKITDQRKANLELLVKYLREKVSKNEEIRIKFICTHNSRRSQFSQVWAQALAHFFGIEKIFCYSGGTEATALFPAVAEALEESGFQIKKISQGDNPVYRIKYSANEHPIIGFSKKLDDDFNPESGFAAVLTCDSANEACPVVPGAAIRIPVEFSDPKIFDNTPEQIKKYREKNLEIATELFYVFSKITS